MNKTHESDILFEYDHILMKSQYRTPDSHAHLATHLILGIGGLLHVTVKEQAFTAHAVIIASDIAHTVYMEHGDMIVYLFDTTSDYSRQLTETYLNGKDFYVAEQRLSGNLTAAWEKAGGSLKTADRLMRKALGIKERTPSGDTRIANALAFLKEAETVPENSADILAERACLSKSRFSHLFKEQMGISLHRYLALEKMKKGYLSFLRGGNITEAAMRAGFDSPSHFAATCKRMFGISFTEFIQNKK